LTQLASRTRRPGLDRHQLQRNLPLDRSYAYNNDGEGVNAYVIDTGILTTHWEFQGRASAIYDFDRG
jgi:subtilisin family serine protease